MRLAAMCPVEISPKGIAMSSHAVEWSILWPALIAGLLVTATHVPLGSQVLKRGIVFIDLAIALQLGESGYVTQLAALAAASAGALTLTWTERRFPDVQEAIIGVAFVLAASVEVILLASNPHGAEHMKDILVGQILWIDTKTLPLVAAVYAGTIALWFTLCERLGRIGFYLLFAVTVTISVQLVGLYLVFASLIVPPLATRRYARHRLPLAYALGVVGYAAGLWLSARFDLPAGPVIVCTLVLLGIALHAFSGREKSAGAAP
jgi:zinc/manganese transport system permease protein